MIWGSKNQNNVLLNSYNSPFAFERMAQRYSKWVYIEVRLSDRARIKFQEKVCKIYGLLNMQIILWDKLHISYIVVLTIYRDLDLIASIRCISFGYCWAMGSTVIRAIVVLKITNSNNKQVQAVLPCVRNTYYMINVSQRKLKEFIGYNWTCIGKTKEGMVSKDTLYSHCTSM